MHIYLYRYLKYLLFYHNKSELDPLNSAQEIGCAISEEHAYAIIKKLKGLSSQYNFRFAFVLLPTRGPLEGIQCMKKILKNEGVTYLNINDIVDDWYGLDESEITLINDTIDFTLDAFRRKNRSIAVKPVDRMTLENYVNTFCSVLNNSFSSPKKVFTDAAVYLGKSPLRVVSVQLVNRSKKTEGIKFFENNELEEVLNELDKTLLEERSPSVYIRRHLRRYSGNTIFIIKPNQKRYWTKSSALCDADKTYTDIMSSWRDIKK